MSRLQKGLLKYGLCILFGLGMVLLFLTLNDYGSADTPVERYRLLADGFTLPGILMVMIAALVWISTQGMFDGLAYCFHMVANVFIPFAGTKIKHKTYFDYKESKKDARASGYGFLFFCGCGFLAVAIVFILLHESVYVPMV